MIQASAARRVPESSSSETSNARLSRRSESADAQGDRPRLDGFGRAVGRLDHERVDLASFVQAAELAVVDVDLAVVLDTDLPVRRPGDPAEAAPVDDKPLVGSRRTGALDLLRARPLRLDHPVDIFGPESLGVVDVELAPLHALGLFPVDFLAAGLDDVQVEVDAVGVPDQGELGVADLDGDAADELAPFAEPGQAKAVAIAGPRVVVGLAAPAARASWRPGT